jgi:putative Mg2+ transporter-C (MgtC) family protein
MMDQFVNAYFNLHEFGWADVCLRVFLAAAFGLFLGLDRDSKGKPVDFRVYMIVAVTTTAIAILAQEINWLYSDQENFMSLDLGKTIAGLMSGIGFLGAGAILKINDEKVVGTATGASIWASGGMGLCLGFGLYGLALVLFVTLALTLVVAGRIASHFTNTDQK